MSRARVGAVAHQFRRIFGSGTVAGLAEWELLRRYVERGDEDAFGAIVARHGPMVLGVCRRVLGDRADSEDAFQVTFLTLARKGGTLGEGDAIGSWLYGVAHRVALRARTASARRRNLERQATAAATSSPDELARRELGSIVAEELSRLPPKYRAPLVLCYIEGLTHEEAAGQLDWPVGTVKGRLSRARDLLKGRLSRRGLEPAGAPNLALLVRGELIQIPVALATRTTRAALDFAAGRTAEGLSASAVALLEMGVESMFWNKLKAAVAVVCVFGTGAAVLAYQGAKDPGEAPEPKAGEARAEPVGKMEPNPPVDPTLATEEVRSEPVRKPAPAPKGAPSPMIAPTNPNGPIGPAQNAAMGGAGFGRFDLLSRIREEAARPAPPSPRNNAIFAKLAEPLAMNFPNPTPIGDVIKYIEHATIDESAGLSTGIPIYVDPQALIDSDKSLASTVELNLQGVDLKITLGLLLKQLGLGYRVKDGMLTICTLADGGDGLPMALMLEKAERGELSKSEYKELIEILKLRKEVQGMANFQ